jgi:PAS domain S-box-containing protein
MKPPPADENNFSSLFEFLPIGAYRSSPGGRQLRANPALVRLNGFQTEAELLAHVDDIGVGWYVQTGRRAEFQALLERDDQVRGFESEIYRYRSRERIWISENAHVVRDPSGAALYYEGTVEEVTDRVKARQDLARSQEELRQIVDLVPGMVYRVIILPNGERRASFVSAGVRELFELDPQDIQRDGKLLHRLRHVDDRPAIEAATAAAAQAEQPLELEYRVVLESGREKWVHVLSAAAPPEGAHRVRVGMAFDITARKRAEQALLDNSQLWKRALESTGDGVWDWQVQAGVEIFSPLCRALYGYSAEEMPDRPDALDSRTHPEDLPRMLADRQAHFSGLTASYVNEHRVRCKDGQWKWVLSRGIVISRDAQGLPLRMIGTHTDISQHKQADALRLERDRAAAADLAKSQFLSRVSHELRTPLNAILGFAQLLELEPGASERQVGWNQHVLASGRHLLALVDDILDLSSIETGQLAVALEPVSLHAAVNSAWAMLAAQAAAMPVALHNPLQADAQDHVLADPKRLRQIISNLLSNAIKYNRSGGWIRLSVTRSVSELSLQIKDSGCGMDAAQLQRLFNPFDRLGAERGPVAGTGLGLALSRQLVLAMGGRIEVNSQPEQGSAFTLVLRAA